MGAKSSLYHSRLYSYLSLGIHIHRRGVHHDTEARFCLRAAYVRRGRCSRHNEHMSCLNFDIYLICVRPSEQKTSLPTAPSSFSSIAIIYEVSTNTFRTCKMGDIHSEGPMNPAYRTRSSHSLSHQSLNIGGVMAQLPAIAANRYIT